MSVPPTLAGVHYMAGGALEVYLRGKLATRINHTQRLLVWRLVVDLWSASSIHGLTRCCPNEFRDEMQLACKVLNTCLPRCESLQHLCLGVPGLPSHHHRRIHQGSVCGILAVGCDWLHAQGLPSREKLILPKKIF